MLKKFLLPVYMVLNGLYCYSQGAREIYSKPTTSYINADYLKTSKTLRTIGWASLGVGIPMTFMGFLAGVTSIETSEGKKTADWMIPCGAALTLSSIPLFIVSHHYKNKAKYTVSLRSQRIEILQIGGEMGIKIQPALTLSFIFKIIKTNLYIKKGVSKIFYLHFS